MSEPSDTAIAVVGMGVEAPGGIETLAGYWDMLAHGAEVIGPMPRDRGWPVAETVALGTREGFGAVPDAGGFLTGATEFDPQWFGITPREAAAMDPQQRVALRVAWRAIEHAGGNPATLAGQEAACYMGASITEYGPPAAAVNEHTGHRGTGTALGAVSGRISHALGLIGPSLTVDTACASSLTALHLAAHAIRDGECEWALAGGVCVMGSPAAFYEFAKQHALATDGHCRSFAAGANGTLWGEGAGVLVLEPVARARACGHRIYGVLAATGVSHNGSGSHLAVPVAQAQQRLIRMTLRRAGMAADAVDLVEGHGTATATGDPAELTALADTYGTSTRRPAVGSVKANLGHAQAASGILGLIKVLLCGFHGQIAPSRYLDRPSTAVDWQAAGLTPAESLRPWPAPDGQRSPDGPRLPDGQGLPDGQRCAAVSSFGIAGANAHAIITMPEPVAAPPQPADYLLPDGSVPVLLSAHTPELLRADAAALCDYLDTRTDVGVNDIAAMLFRTRSPRRHRALARVRDVATLREALAAVAAGTEHPNVVVGVSRSRRPALVFPGQGSQRPGMGKLYYAQSPAFRAEADRCAAVFEELFEWSPLPYLLDDTLPDTTDVSVVQPALFVLMVGLAAMWTAAGVRAAMVVGHSQGEIAGAYVSGVMSLADAVRILTVRARLVESMAPDGYSMAILGTTREDCEALLARNTGWAQLSVVNSPHIVAVSGEKQTIATVVAAVSAQGNFAKEIRVAYPAHTTVVARFQTELPEALGDTMDSTVFHATDIACIGATLGEALTTDLPAVDYWFWNLRNPVRFDRAVTAALAAGADLFVEVCEHPILALAIQENLHVVDPARAQDIPVIGTSRRSATDLTEFTQALAACAVSAADYDWSALRTRPQDCALALPLSDFPPAAMQRMRLWAAPVRTVEPIFEHATPDAPVPDRGAHAAVPQQQVVESWRPLSQRTLRPPRTLLVWDPTGQSRAVAEALPQAAARHGATVVPAGASHTGPASVVVLVPSRPDLDVPAAVAALADYLPAHAQLPAPDADTDCWIITTDAESVVDGDSPQLFSAAVAAGLRAAAADQPGLIVRQLDVPAAANAGELAAAVVAAVHTVGEPALALRAGTFLTKRLHLDSTRDTPPRLRHVVITGGTGAVGMHFCAELVRRGAERITLCSRTGGAREQAAALHALGDTEIRVDAVDVTDATALARWAEQLPPATLVVHAASGYVDTETTAVTAESVQAACAAKVLGAAQIARLLPRTPDCRVLCCSSVSASMGGRGQRLYAAANRMLDALAAALRQDGIDCRSVQWGLWPGRGLVDGAAMARVQRAGLQLLDPEAAVDAGLHVPVGNSMLVAADWSRVRALLEPAGQARLVDELTVAVRTPTQTPTRPIEPGVVIRQELASVMGVTDPAALDDTMPLVALGLDSVQALDFRSRIVRTLGQEIPVAAVLGGASLDELVRLLGTENQAGAADVTV